MSSRHSGSHGGSLEEKVLSDDVTSFENAGLMTPLVNQKWKVAAKPSMAHQFQEGSSFLTKLRRSSKMQV